MPMYALLMRLTDQGARDIKAAPARVDAASKVWEAMGGRLTGVWFVTGEYDYLAVGEAPSDEAALSFAMTLAAQGNVRTTTLKAFTPGEFAAMVGRVP